MFYDLPAHNLYGNEPVKLELPDSWDIKICSFRGATAPALTEMQIAEKINQPVGTGTIARDARGSKDAVLIFDDITRPTPIGPIAKAVIAELEEAGVPRNKIRFVCAVGAHRAMSREDYVRKLGEDLVQEFRIYSHNPFFNNVYLGRTTYGVPIELNAECVYADYKVGIGAAFPHPTTGFGGGAKLILPGIASLESIRRYHANADSTNGDTLTRWDPDVVARQNTLQAAEFLGLNFKIDVLLNGKGEIADLYAGHFDANITGHVGEMLEFYATEYAGKADVVIANNYFKPTEPRMAFDQTFLLESVNQGGDIILSAHSPQGIIPHYNYGVWGDTGIGGTMFSGPSSIPGHINRYFAFSRFQDKGLNPVYDSGDRLIYATDWSEILGMLGSARKRVAIYPYATVSYFKSLCGEKQ